MPWEKGQSGNIKGRPKGKTMKEFARHYLLKLSREDKLKFLKALPADILWKMAEGNPSQESDIKVQATFSLKGLLQPTAQIEDEQIKALDDTLKDVSDSNDTLKGGNDTSVDALKDKIEDILEVQKDVNGSKHPKT